MRKNYTSIIILFFILAYVLVFPKEISTAVTETLAFFMSFIFPTLFPFFLLSEFLLNYGFISPFSLLLRPITKLFKLRKETAFVIGMSMFSGFPSSARNTKRFLDEGVIDEYEASKLLTFTHFANPLFILGTVGLFLNGNQRITLLVLLVHFSTNFIIGFLFRNYYVNNSTQNYKVVNFKEKNYGEVLTTAIIGSLKTLSLIFGTMCILFIVTNMINSIFIMNSLLQCIINGLMDFNKGFYLMSDLNIAVKLKAILAGVFISFGGISVHTQVISIISKTKIKYLPYLIARVIHAALAGIFIYLLFNIFS